MDTFILIGITGIGLGALYFLVASGLSLIYGLMGVLNFAHGSFLTVGAFVGFWLARTLGPETSMPEFILAPIFDFCLTISALPFSSVTLPMVAWQLMLNNISDSARTCNIQCNYVWCCGSILCN
jgi:branched-subunit amino acid ABC-type transport system permease component